MERDRPYGTYDGRRSFLGTSGLAREQTSATLEGVVKDWKINSKKKKSVMVLISLITRRGRYLL